VFKIGGYAKEECHKDMTKEPDRQEEVNQAIEKLWSASDAERLEGKQQIQRLGSHPAASLLALLEDLYIDRHLRFPRGKESEGNTALARALDQERERENRIETRTVPLDVAKEVEEALSILGP